MSKADRWTEALTLFENLSADAYVAEDVLALARWLDEAPEATGDDAGTETAPEPASASVVLPEAGTGTFRPIWRDNDGRREFLWLNDINQPEWLGHDILRVRPARDHYTMVYREVV